MSIFFYYKYLVKDKKEAKKKKNIYIYIYIQDKDGNLKQEQILIFLLQVFNRIFSKKKKKVFNRRNGNVKVKG